MHVFITGASGLIGCELVETLQVAGHQVTRLVRHPAKSDEERQWDSTAVSLSPTLLEECDVLVHLAGESIAAGRWTKRRKARIFQSRVETTKLLANTISQMEQPPQAFVVASAVGYYGDAGATVLTETSPPGHNFLAEVCQAWEAAADPVRSLTRVVHVRTGMVLSEKGGALTPMLTPFKLGLGGVIGSGKQFWSWITLRDITRLFAFVIENELACGPINGVSPHPVTAAEFTASLGKRCHRPTFLPVPAIVARMAIGEMANDLILASTRVEPAAALALGFEFADPELQSALAALPL